MNACHNTLIQTHTVYNTKSVSLGKPCALGDYEKNVHFFLCKKKFDTVMSYIDNSGGYVCMEVGSIWEISASSSIFYYKPKIPLKIIF